VGTASIDKNDPVLGFFHNWVKKFSENYESINVICLYKGECDLPKNVRVFSLGKEKGESKIKYILNFYKYIWQLRNDYNSIFVHMNQEYILLAGVMWKIMNKNVYMWRNHHSGSLLTDIASIFCKKVFCTSKFSYTAKYSKTEIMPVGVDLENFKPNKNIARLTKSILSIGRISPSKNIHILVDVINKINDPSIKVAVYGDPIEKDNIYYEELKKKSSGLIEFHKGVPNIETIDLYSKYEIFINLSSSGMYDKTIFEAMACGCIVIASNENLRGNINDDLIFKNDDIVELENKIRKVLNYSEEEKKEILDSLYGFYKNHSLDILSKRLFDTIQ
jgi:glycosyltransferase involved in cell wall biosynthesis